MKHTDEDLIEAMSFQMAAESERADKLTQGEPARPSNVETGTCGESKEKNQGTVTGRKLDSGYTQKLYSQN